jgi:hypothetical protein
MPEAWGVFLLARIAWTVEGRGGGYTAFATSRIDTPYGEDRRFVPVAAFAERDEAEARRRELELEAARLFNPFCVLGPLTVLTTQPEREFRRRLGELVGPLPDAALTADGRLRHWQPWWDEQMPAWTDETLAAVWELFDAIHFYAVLEVDAL